MGSDNAPLWRALDSPADSQEVTIDILPSVTTLTFDVYGTLLDLNGRLVPAVAELLQQKGSSASPEEFRKQWRARQRIEQYQDTILMVGHSGYLETSRRAFLHTLRLNDVPASDKEVEDVMRVWWELSPFDDVAPALEKLQTRYKLVALSNGDPDYLNHICLNRIGWQFYKVISASEVGCFKPHPAVYRHALRVLDLEPAQVAMVAAHGFDIMGARSCGYRGVYVNRYNMPYEESPYQPDVTVGDFRELPEVLL